VRGWRSTVLLEGLTVRVQPDGCRQLPVPRPNYHRHESRLTPLVENSHYIPLSPEIPGHPLAFVFHPRAFSPSPPLPPTVSPQLLPRSPVKSNASYKTSPVLSTMTLPTIPSPPPSNAAELKDEGFVPPIYWRPRFFLRSGQSLSGRI
jgi:hypothetical protein